MVTEGGTTTARAKSCAACAARRWGPARLPVAASPRPALQFHARDVRALATRWSPTALTRTSTWPPPARAAGRPARPHALARWQARWPSHLAGASDYLTGPCLPSAPFIDPLQDSLRGRRARQRGPRLSFTAGIPDGREFSRVVAWRCSATARTNRANASQAAGGAGCAARWPTREKDFPRSSLHIARTKAVARAHAAAARGGGRPVGAGPNTQDNPGGRRQNRPTHHGAAQVADRARTRRKRCSASLIDG